jgi:hypothetical protein
MVGPDDQSGVGLITDSEWSAADVAQPTHADLGQGEPRLDPPIRLYSCVDYPGATWESKGPDSKKVRLIRHAVGDFACGLIHPE